MKTVSELKFDAFPIVDENKIAVDNSNVTVLDGYGHYSVTEEDGAFTQQAVNYYTQLGNTDDFVLTIDHWKLSAPVGEGNEAWFYSQMNDGDTTYGLQFIIGNNNVVSALAFLFDEGIEVLARCDWSGGTDQLNEHTYVFTRTSGVYSCTRDGVPLSKTTSTLDNYALTPYNDSYVGNFFSAGVAFDSIFGGVKLEKTSAIITPNLYDNDCTSIAGWTENLITGTAVYEIAGGGIHFQTGEDGVVWLSKQFVSAGYPVTIEFKTKFNSSDCGQFNISFVNHTSSGTIMFTTVWDVYFAPGNAPPAELAAPVPTEETTWRMELNCADEVMLCIVFKDNELVGIFPSESSTGDEQPCTIVLALGMGVGEAYLMPNIKVGDGLGEFLSAPSTYTLTYDGNGNTSGTVPVDASSPYDSGATVTVLANINLLKTGSIFHGWNTSADGSGTDYAPAATFSITSNTTLYAQWIESGDKIQLKNISLIKPALEKISLTTPCLIKSK